MESEASSPIQVSTSQTVLSNSSQIDSESPLLSPFGRRNKMRVEGHRGMGRYEPENTLQAFASAADEQLDGVELDVWLTKDKKVVVIHAHEIDGVDGYVYFDNGSKKLIYELTLKEIRSLKVLNGNLVPTLDEVLRLTKDRVSVNIEFKGTDLQAAEEVLKLCKIHKILDQVQFSSFNWKFAPALDLAREILEIRARPPFGFLTEELNITESFLLGQYNDGVTFGMDLIHKNMDEFKKIAKEVKNKGFKVKVYFPFAHNEIYDDYDLLDSLEADTLITNEPYLLKRYYEKSLTVVN